MTDLDKDAQALFDTYLDCWNKRDFEGVAACFSQPAMFILPNATVAIPDQTALVAMLQKVFAGLEAAGFSHTTIGGLSAKPCGQDTAILDASRVDRIKHDGSLLERIDGHYVMKRIDGQWRLVVALACDTGWQA